MAAKFTRRSIGQMILLMLVTFGIYMIYWLYTTKEELNKSSAQIPTFFFFFIPFANLYFLYKFAEAFCAIVLKDKTQAIAYFVLLVCLFPVAELILQSQMNKRRGILS